VWSYTLLTGHVMDYHTCAIRKATRPLFVDWVTFNNIGWVLRVFKKGYVKMVDLLLRVLLYIVKCIEHGQWQRAIIQRQSFCILLFASKSNFDIYKIVLHIGLIMHFYFQPNF